MNSFLTVMRKIILICFILFHQYSFAQTEYNKALLLNKTWKLQSMTLVNGEPVRIEVPNDLIQFKNDSIWENRRGNDTMEGKWYFDGPEYLIIQETKVNGNQVPSNSHKSYLKIKELDSDQLILIYLEREGNHTICTYKSISGN